MLGVLVHISTSRDTLSVTLKLSSKFREVPRNFELQCVPREIQRYKIVLVLVESISRSSPLNCSSFCHIDVWSLDTTSINRCYFFTNCFHHALALGLLSNHPETLRDISSRSPVIINAGGENMCPLGSSSGHVHTYSLHRHYLLESPDGYSGDLCRVEAPNRCDKNWKWNT
eukprot:sb/3472183/